MDYNDLLQNLRLIVRDEMTPFMERVDARFDQLNTLLYVMNVRFDRIESQCQSINALLERIGPTNPRNPFHAGYMTQIEAAANHA